MTKFTCIKTGRMKDGQIFAHEGKEYWGHRTTGRSREWVLKTETSIGQNPTHFMDSTFLYKYFIESDKLVSMEDNLFVI